MPTSSTATSVEGTQQPPREGCRWQCRRGNLQGGGLYGPALEQVCYWLEQAQQYAENDKQAAALRHLVDYYRTGDLEKWSLYNINWVKDTEGDIDYINGFVEVYNDPLGYTGSYETIVQIKDFEASARMAVMMDNAQWFEDHMPSWTSTRRKSRRHHLQRGQCGGRSRGCLEHSDRGQPAQCQLDPHPARFQEREPRQHH